MKTRLLIIMISVFFCANSQAQKKTDFETFTHRCEIHLNSDGKVRGTIFGKGNNIIGTFYIKKTRQYGFIDWNGKQLAHSVPIVIIVKGDVSIQHIKQALEYLDLQNVVPEIEILNTLRPTPPLSLNLPESP